MPYRRLMDRGEAPPWSEGWNHHHHHLHHSSSGTTNEVLIIAGVAAFVAILVVIGAIVVIFILVRRSQRHAELLSNSSCTTTTTMKLRRFSYGELKLATGNFSERNKLGQGGFSTVYKGFLRDGHQVAVKKLDSNSSRQECEFWNEISVVWLAAKSQHVVPLLGFCHHGDGHRLLVYEFMSNGSLQEALFVDSDSGSSSFFPLGWETRFRIALDTAKALAFLHSECEPPVVHGDIKPSNILLDKQFGAHIADFGLARFKSENDTAAARDQYIAQLALAKAKRRRKSNQKLDSSTSPTTRTSNSSSVSTISKDSVVSSLSPSSDASSRELQERLSSIIEVQPESQHQLVQLDNHGGIVDFFIDEKIQTKACKNMETANATSDMSKDPHEGDDKTSFDCSVDGILKNMESSKESPAILKPEVEGSCKISANFSADGIGIRTKAFKNTESMKGSLAMSKEELEGDDKTSVDLSVDVNSGEAKACNCKDTESTRGSAADTSKEDLEANNSIKVASTMKEYVMEWLGDVTARKEKPKPKEGEEEEEVASEWGDGHSEDVKMAANGGNNGRIKECRQWWKEEDMLESRKNGWGRKSTSLEWWKEEVIGGVGPTEQRKGRRREQSTSIGSSSTPSTRGTICYVAPEYGSGGGPLSEKCDVYSFGVLLLVIISGRRPLQVNVFSPLTEFERGNLVSWARHLAHSGGSLLDLVDASLAAEFPPHQALLCIQVALLCLRRTPAARPTMNKVVEFLSKGGMQISPLTPQTRPHLFPLN